MDQMNQQGKTCNCPHHKVMPWGILLVGIAILLGALNILTSMAVQVAVAVILIIIGGFKLNGSKCGCCAKNH